METTAGFQLLHQGARSGHSLLPVEIAVEGSGHPGEPVQVASTQFSVHHEPQHSLRSQPSGHTLQGTDRIGRVMNHPGGVDDVEPFARSEIGVKIQKVHLPEMQVRQFEFGGFLF